MSDLLRLPERRLRLAYFGTPEIARVMLERILDANEDDVIFVVSQPDKPKGRGKIVEPTPVKTIAESRGIVVHQPLKLKDGFMRDTMRAAELDLAIVVAYGRILPDDVFGAPKFGTWNAHASLLPRHRGASPIQHAIASGDAATGVVLMQLTAGLDEGDMLYTRRLELRGDETAGSLTAALSDLGGEALVEGLRIAKREGLAITPQDGACSTYAPLIEKSAGRLDFTEAAEVIERKVRAFDPWPGAFVLQKDEQPLKILKMRVVPTLSGAPGTVLEAGPALVVATSTSGLAIEMVQPPGKKAMPAADFLRGAGRNIRVGTQFPGV